jgi:hypothetical protein
LLSTLVMLAAIDLNDDLPLGAQKIDDAAVDGDLSLEFQAGEPTVAQAKPENAFGVGLISAQSSGEFWVSLRHPNPLTPTLSPPGRGSAPFVRRCQRPYLDPSPYRFG